MKKDQLFLIFFHQIAKMNCLATAVILVAAGSIASAADREDWTESQLTTFAADIAKYASETRQHYEVDPAKLELDSKLSEMAAIYAKAWAAKTFALDVKQGEAWVKEMQKKGVTFDYIKQVLGSAILINSEKAEHLDAKTIVTVTISSLDKNAKDAPDMYDDRKYCKRLKYLMWQTTRKIGAAAFFQASDYDSLNERQRPASNRYVIFLDPGRKRNEKEVKGKLSDKLRKKLQTLGCQLDRDLTEKINNAEFANQVLDEVNKLRKAVGLTELKSDDSALSTKVKDFATAWALEDEAPKQIPASILYRDSNDRDTAMKLVLANAPLAVAELLTADKLLEKLTTADKNKEPLPVLAGATPPDAKDKQPTCPRLKQLLCSDATKLGVYAAGYEANYDFPYRNYYYALAMDADCKTPKFSQKVQEELKQHKCEL